MASRFRSIIGALIALLVIAVGVPTAQAADYTWKIGVVDPPDYFMTQLTEEWASLVSAKTGKKVSSKVFPSGQLGGDVDMLESLRTGTLQVWEGGALVLSAFDPINDIWALPYLFENDDHRYRFWDRSKDKVADIVAEKTGYRIVAVLNGPNRQLTTTKPVRRLQDLKGMKIRVPQVQPFVRLWNLLGSAAVPMPFTEVYTSLQTKVVDGQENDVMLSLSSGFFDVAKYLVLTQHVAYDGFIVFNEKYYRTLPDNVKAAISEASREITVKSRSLVANMEGEAIEEARRQKKVEVIKPDLAPFREAAKKMLADYPQVAPILQLIDAAR